MDFRLFNGEAVISRIPLKKDSATVIAPGKMVTLDGNNLAVEADASSTVIAYAEFGAEAGETTVLVVKEKEAIFVGTANTAYYAITDTGLICDLAISGSNQLINLGASVTGVFQVNVREDAGMDGSVIPVQVFINKPLVGNM